MIPNIIHYCWFGDNPMPADQQAYVDGWKILMPNFEFKCWTEKDIDIDSIPFAKQAYEARKFAYVADYTRIYALYNEGGIYMDTDVMLRTSLEPFRNHGVFTSYEYTPSRKQLPIVKSMLTPEGNRLEKGVLKRIPGTGLFSALIGCEKGHPFIKDCLDYYNDQSFHDVFNQHLTVPNILAFHAEKYGLLYKNIKQHLNENFVIYDNRVFASVLVATDKSLAVHYCAASWVKKSYLERIKGKIYNIRLVRNFINTFFPKN